MQHYTIIQALRDFTVGPNKFDVVIKKGMLRAVELYADGEFCTHTISGTFFGVCNIKDGWEILGEVKIP